MNENNTEKSGLAKRSESREGFCFRIKERQSKVAIKHISEKETQTFSRKLFNQVRG